MQYQRGRFGAEAYRPIMTDPRGKFKPNWEGTYLAKKLFSKGATILSYLEGNEFREPIKLDKLKKILSVKSR